MRSNIRLISISLLLLLVGTSVYAQNRQTRKADRHFQRFEYTSAIKEYLKLVDRQRADAYVHKQLADSYYFVFNSGEAVKWYKEALKEAQDAETHFRYAQMLKAQGKYEEANKQMQAFASKAPQDSRAVAFKQDPNYLPRLQDKKKLYDIQLLDMNSDKSDFGAVLYNDRVYFASARNGKRRTFKWTNEPYLDIYSASYNLDGTVTNPEEVKGLNTRWHDGPVVFTPDGKTAIYATESFNQSKGFEKDKESNSKFGQVSLFMSKWMNDKWSEAQPLPFASTEYSTSNPSLTKDGRTLYFSSNMPGGQGGIDIWKVSINADGSFGTPENLGSRVNTASDESFPFIAEDGHTLYFASKGHAGFGGYDIFMIDLKGKNEVVNLGAPVNGAQDDFAFSYYPAKEVGFMSSNRSGVDNLYKLKPVCGVPIYVTVTDAKTGKTLAGAKVSILDDRKNVIASELANAKGEVSFYGECKKAYTIAATMPQYEGNAFPVEASNGQERKISAALNPIEVIITEKEVILKEVFFEFDKHNITEEGAFELDKLVQVMEQYPNMVIMVKSHTDNRGSAQYNQRLSDRRAKATVEYVLSKGISKDRISGKGYGESEPKVDCQENCTEEEHAENRRSEFIIVRK